MYGLVGKTSCNKVAESGQKFVLLQIVLEPFSHLDSMMPTLAAV